jgi:hypothetical protein
LISASLSINLDQFVIKQVLFVVPQREQVVLQKLATAHVAKIMQLPLRLPLSLLPLQTLN